MKIIKEIIKVRCQHKILVLTLIFSFVFQLGFSQTPSIDSLLDLSLSELMNVKVHSASDVEESKIDVPASIVLITAEEITQRGYTDLSEVLIDLPGFDNIIANGTAYHTAYQRGYRTPFTQRTLFLINGKEDNHLWTHDADISRQIPISNIEKIEIVYGATSAVYGPNAFLGVINIITKDGQNLKKGKNETIFNLQYGSNNTMSYDIGTVGNTNKFSYSFSHKLFTSDELDLSKKWGFLSNELYSDTSIWGPILTIDANNRRLGEYKDKAENIGFIGDVTFKDFKLGVLSWQTKEGYGPYYAADRAQNNASWNKSSTQIYLEHNKEVNTKLTSNFLTLYRENRVWGNWAEAEPDFDDSVIPNDTLIENGSIKIIEHFKDYSYISFTNWNSNSSSWLLKEKLSYKFNPNFHLSAGINFERKQLTRSYDIPGYWIPSYSSSNAILDDGPYGYGAGIYHSSNENYIIPPTPDKRMPKENLIHTNDIGGYLQGILKAKQFIFHIGVRMDNNSLYGSSINPRITINRKTKDQKGVVKFLYGRAFQEPAPIQLFGGWNGRNANPNLLPERVENHELTGLYQFKSLLLDASIFYASYTNVIKEEAENSGERNIYGGELKTHFYFKNFITKAPKITGYLFYSYTKAISSLYYDHFDTINDNKWKEGERTLGDIAPHKVNIGANLPLSNKLNLNLRGNFVSARLVYLRNTLRARDYEIKPYFTLDGNMNYIINKFTFSVKVKNILNANYFHPGPESASAGDDFSNRSLGYHNSLLPQVGRTYMLSILLRL